MLSSVEAAERFGYTSDYVARLARQGKIKAGRVGRQWFVDPNSLEAFRLKTQQALEKRNRALKAVRKAERHQANTIHEPLSVRAKVLAQRTFPGAHLYAPQLRALVQTGALVASGMLLGIIVHGTDTKSLVASLQNTCFHTQTCTVQVEAVASDAYAFLEALPGRVDAYVQKNVEVGLSHSSNAADDMLASSGVYVKTFDAILNDVAYTIAFYLGLLPDDAHVAQYQDTKQNQREGMVMLKENEVDEKSVEDIRESFSDEVEVRVDPNDPSTGIVTPVFRDRTGEAYRFLMVPLHTSQ